MRSVQPLGTPASWGPDGEKRSPDGALRTRVRGSSPLPQPRDSPAGHLERGLRAAARSWKRSSAPPPQPFRSGQEPQAAPRLQPLRLARDLATYWASTRAAPRWWANSWSASGAGGSGRLEERPPLRWSAPRGAPGSPRCRKRAGHVGAALCSHAGGGAARSHPPRSPTPTRACLPPRACGWRWPIVGGGGVPPPGRGVWAPPAAPTHWSSLAPEARRVGGSRDDGLGKLGCAGGKTRPPQNSCFPWRLQPQGRKLLLSRVLPSGGFVLRLLFILRICK